MAKLTKAAARSSGALACVLGLACSAGRLAAADGLPPDFVRLADVAPTVVQDIRYATANNFTGRPVPGYDAPQCWLRAEAAAALALAAQDLAGKGWQLVVYDCYRPQRAVGAFVAWAKDPGEQSRKADFYPVIDKRQLFALGYIARVSGHSTGFSADAGALEISSGKPVDFGTAFDLFDPRSATASRAVGSKAQASRRALVAAFAKHGFANYAGEWWHFSFSAGSGAAGLDVPVMAGSGR